MLHRLKMIAAWCVSASVFVPTTAATLVFGALAQLVALPWDPDRRVSGLATKWLWGAGFFRLNPIFRLVITGRERAGGRGRIIVANHASMLDIPLLMQLPVPVKITARPGVFRMPVYGWMASFSGQLSIDPDADVQALITRVRGLLDRGISVVVFPEGTRGDGKTLLDFKRGAFELAIRCEAEVLPVALRNTADALARGGPWSRELWPRVAMHVLPPISSVGRTRRELSRLTKAAIEATLAGPSPLDLSDTCFTMYRSLGRFAAGFAWGKTRFDPCFWAAWERLPREGVILDLGAGEGLLGSYLHAAGSRVSLVGLDVDEARIRRARAVASPGDQYDVGDARTAPLPEGCAAVVALDVLHYLQPAEQDAVLARMVAALAPGGMILLRDPDTDRGAAAAWTVASERGMVAAGRHQGEGVHAQGGAALAARVAALPGVVEVRVEDASAGPFANVLVSARVTSGG